MGGQGLSGIPLQFCMVNVSEAKVRKCWHSSSCSVVCNFATPWAVARQDPLSTGFSRPEYWSGEPFPSPGDLPDPGIDSVSLHCRQILYQLSYPERECDYSLQFCSVPQTCPTLCDPMDCSTSGLSVHHQLPEFTQTHFHIVSEAIQPSHPLASPSPPAFNLPQYQGLFQ